MYFCMRTCITARVHQRIMQQYVACSNNNQAQLHTHESVPYWSPDVWPGLQLLRNIQLGLPAWPEVGVAQPPLSKFLNPPLFNTLSLEWDLKTKTINIKFKLWLTVFWSVLKANNLCVAAGPVSSDLTSIANTDAVSGSWQTYVIFSTGTLSVTDWGREPGRGRKGGKREGG